ncbi:ubiquitin 3 binding protein But2 C-terminal domain-containing protein [Cryomyces antarcticus]
MLTSALLAIAASVATASAQVYKGFNYGSTFTNGAAKVQADFQNEFTTAQRLVGASGFSSARLYTMIQGGTTNTPIEAIPAAIATKTTLLLGLWASAGQANFNNELAALSSAIKTYGTAFTDLIAGISVGSEDLYRISPTGIINLSGAGAQPADVANYIGQVRSLVAGTGASGKPIGHVDTWTAWVNSTNQAVINACDFIGIDAYPYFENTLANSIGNSRSQFFSAYDATIAAVGGKPVWVTETGWPVSGPTQNQAVPSTANAKTYWDEVGCSLFGTTNTWWYVLQDAAPTTPSPSFGIVGSTLSTTPLYDLTCPAASSSSSAAASSAPAASGASSASSVSVTSVSSASATTALPGSSAAGSASAPAGSPPQSVASTLATVTKTSAPASNTASASSCPADLSGSYEFPHLIVPVDSSAPDKAYGTSYNGKISSTVSSIFNFDIPASDAGKTCSLVFLLPAHDQLQTSAYTLTGSGGISVAELTAPATEQTTYNTVPKVAVELGTTQVKEGGAYVVTSHACGAGQRIAFEVRATGSLKLDFFQDYNPSPLGFYVRVC